MADTSSISPDDTSAAISDTSATTNPLTNSNPLDDAISNNSNSNSSGGGASSGADAPVGCPACGTVAANMLEHLNECSTLQFIKQTQQNARTRMPTIASLASMRPTPLDGSGSGSGSGAANGVSPSPPPPTSPTSSAAGSGGGVGGRTTPGRDGGTKWTASILSLARMKRDPKRRSADGGSHQRIVPNSMSSVGSSAGDTTDELGGDSSTTATKSLASVTSSPSVVRHPDGTSTSGAASSGSSDDDSSSGTETPKRQSRRQAMIKTASMPDFSKNLVRTATSSTNNATAASSSSSNSSNNSAGGALNELEQLQQFQQLQLHQRQQLQLQLQQPQLASTAALAGANQVMRPGVEVEVARILAALADRNFNDKDIWEGEPEVHGVLRQFLVTFERNRATRKSKTNVVTFRMPQHAVLQGVSSKTYKIRNSQTCSEIMKTICRKLKLPRHETYHFETLRGYKLNPFDPINYYGLGTLFDTWELVIVPAENSDLLGMPSSRSSHNLSGSSSNNTNNTVSPRLSARGVSGGSSGAALMGSMGDAALHSSHLALANLSLVRIELPQIEYFRTTRSQVIHVEPKVPIHKIIASLCKRWVVDNPAQFSLAVKQAHGYVVLDGNRDTSYYGLGTRFTRWRLHLLPSDLSAAAKLTDAAVVPAANLDARFGWAQIEQAALTVDEARRIIAELSKPLPGGRQRQASVCPDGSAAAAAAGTAAGGVSSSGDGTVESELPRFDEDEPPSALELQLEQLREERAKTIAELQQQVAQLLAQAADASGTKSSTTKDPSAVALAAKQLEVDNLSSQVKALEGIALKVKEVTKKRAKTVEDTLRALRTSEQSWRQKFQELEESSASTTRSNRALRDYVDSMKDALERSEENVASLEEKNRALVLEIEQLKAAAAAVAAGGKRQRAAATREESPHAAGDEAASQEATSESAAVPDADVEDTATAPVTPTPNKATVSAEKQQQPQPQEEAYDDEEYYDDEYYYEEAPVQPPPPPNLPLGVLLLRCQVNYMSPDSPGSPFRKGGITPITLNEMKFALRPTPVVDRRPPAAGDPGSMIEFLYNSLQQRLASIQEAEDLDDDDDVAWEEYDEEGIFLGDDDMEEWFNSAEQ